MCHGYWQRRLEEREASRRMWDEFERTEPLNEPAVTEEDAEVTLEETETTQVAAQD
jgi:hypothetical protein